MQPEKTSFLSPKENPPPKDGSLLLLLVKVVNEKDEWFPAENSSVFRTIGFNSLHDTGEDLWECAGWCWCNDHYLSTTGEILGWLPLPGIPPELLTQYDTPG